MDSSLLLLYSLASLLAAGALTHLNMVVDLNPLHLVLGGVLLYRPDTVRVIVSYAVGVSAWRAWLLSNAYDGAHTVFIAGAWALHDDLQLVWVSSVFQLMRCGVAGGNAAAQTAEVLFLGMLTVVWMPKTAPGLGWFLLAVVSRAAPATRGSSVPQTPQPARAAAPWR